MSRYYLGLNAHGPKISECLFARGNDRDLREFAEVLAKKYNGAPMLAKNGRSALTLALKAYFDWGDKIIINGFTCYAVYEAVIQAGMVPVFADINRETLNFDTKTLDDLWEKSGALPGKASSKHAPKGIIVQNTLGNPVDMAAIEKFAKKHELKIIEDLAHSAGIKYPDRREAGTVGVATVLSFGRDKSINTISGGAVIFRETQKHGVEAPFRAPRISDKLRTRFYPLLAGICRGLGRIHLGGPLMRFFMQIHWVERTADSRLDTTRRPPKFVAKMATKQIREFHHRGQGVLREFYLVKNRPEVLGKLREAGYYFDGFWYERPVSPERYYEKVNFPEKRCPVATEVAAEIINFPTYYSKKELESAMKIIQPYLIDGKAKDEKGGQK